VGILVLFVGGPVGGWHAGAVSTDSWVSLAFPSHQFPVHSYELVKVKCACPLVHATCTNLCMPVHKACTFHFRVTFPLGSNRNGVLSTSSMLVCT
jgi:hypothetical protein